MPRTFDVTSGAADPSRDASDAVDSSFLDVAWQLEAPQRRATTPGVRMPLPGLAGRVAPGGRIDYRLVRGDTLTEISKAAPPSFRRTVGELQRLNGIRDPDRIHAGSPLLLLSDRNMQRIQWLDGLEQQRIAARSLARGLDMNPAERADANDRSTGQRALDGQRGVVAAYLADGVTGMAHDGAAVATTLVQMASDLKRLGPQTTEFARIVDESRVTLESSLERTFGPLHTSIAAAQANPGTWDGVRTAAVGLFDGLIAGNSDPEATIDTALDMLVSYGPVDGSYSRALADASYEVLYGRQMAAIDRAFQEGGGSRALQQAAQVAETTGGYRMALILEGAAGTIDRSIAQIGQERMLTDRSPLLASLAAVTDRAGEDAAVGRPVVERIARSVAAAHRGEWSDGKAAPAGELPVAFGMLAREGRGVGLALAVTGVLQEEKRDWEAGTLLGLTLGGLEDYQEMVRGRVDGLLGDMPLMLHEWPGNDGAVESQIVRYLSRDPGRLGQVDDAGYRMTLIQNALGDALPALKGGAGHDRLEAVQRSIAGEPRVDLAMRISTKAAAAYASQLRQMSISEQALGAPANWNWTERTAISEIQAFAKAPVSPTSAIAAGRLLADPVAREQVGRMQNIWLNTASPERREKVLSLLRSWVSRPGALPEGLSPRAGVSPATPPGAGLGMLQSFLYVDQSLRYMPQASLDSVSEAWNAAFVYGYWVPAGGAEILKTAGGIIQQEIAAGRISADNRLARLTDFAAVDGRKGWARLATGIDVVGNTILTSYAAYLWGQGDHGHATFNTIAATGGWGAMAPARSALRFVRFGGWFGLAVGVVGDGIWTNVERSKAAATHEPVSRDWLKGMGVPDEYAGILADRNADGEGVGPLLPVLAKELSMDGATLLSRLVGSNSPEKVRAFVGLAHRVPHEDGGYLMARPDTLAMKVEQGLVGPEATFREDTKALLRRLELEGKDLGQVPPGLLDMVPELASVADLAQWMRNNLNLAG
ncbi:LysM peptidoglycan-binding domain-containing protein [Inquilinus sp. OTU3971]|uniref:LysM peptidoglycan-binding domain-containing protein n=1 Tax=Inquilinus sp. OTU3971 TaxID=3043855 RepID=UPI00313E2F89